MITLPLRCTHGYPRYPLSGIAASVPHFHPAGEGGTSSDCNMNSSIYVLSNCNRQLRERSI